MFAGRAEKTKWYVPTGRNIMLGMKITNKGNKINISLRKAFKNFKST